MLKKAMYVGTFDPLTLGHLDIIQRASAFVDELYVVVSDQNLAKQSLIPIAQRIKLIEQAVNDISRVSVVEGEGLTVEMLRAKNIKFLIRSLRSEADFEQESTLAWSNRALWPSMETLLLFGSPEYRHISSSIVREIAKLGGDLTPFVPKNIKFAMQMAGKR